MWWQALASIAVGLVAVYATLLALLWRSARRSPGAANWHEALRLLPDVLRLIRRLAADRSLPRGVRLRLVILLAYLVSPIDLVPDFIPVIGFADDAVIVALALRAVIRRAGADALTRHWPGTAH